MLQNNIALTTKTVLVSYAARFISSKNSIIVAYLSQSVDAGNYR